MKQKFEKKSADRKMTDKKMDCRVALLLAMTMCFAGQISEANAQTCIKTPTCADLGYAQSATDCTGKTILKCPLDTSKVYCPSDTETAKTYKIGDYYYYNGNAVGKVISINGSDLTVASTPTVATENSVIGVSSYCSKLNAAAGAWFPLTTKDYCNKTRAVWSALQESFHGLIISADSAYCSTSTGCSCYTSGSSYTYYYVCLSTFKA